MILKIHEVAEPTNADWKSMLDPLTAFNVSRLGPARLAPIVLSLKAESGEVLGGLFGHACWNWLYIDILFVPEVARGRGLGTKLLERAEEFAREKGCGGVWLDTFTREAADFYRKRGYETFATLENYPGENQRIFFRKMLEPAPL
jgi:GNAT superfamily N-acetyltransferase